MKIKKILECPSLEVCNQESIEKYIRLLKKEKKGGYSVAINAEKIMMYRYDPFMKKTIDESILPSPDGVAVVIGYRWLYGIKTIRVDLPNTILKIAHEDHAKVFLLGAKEEVNALAAANISLRYPGIEICGRQNGYVDDWKAVNKDLKASDADYVFVCLGSPKQEHLMPDLMEALPKALFIGCGGALDVMSGRTKRAPVFYQNNGLEWFYRIMQRPSLIKRKWVYVPFMIFLIIDSIKCYFNSSKCG